MRKSSLVEKRVYHVFNKSIAGYTIFNDYREFNRVLGAICFYQVLNKNISFADSVRTSKEKNEKFSIKGKKLVEIVAYCLMPTHFHLILEQLEDKGVSVFMQNLQNSYARYFNLRHKRKGPLWEGTFKYVAIESDEQLLHMTRYVHLNPVTAYIVDNPENWPMSSYIEYVSEKSNKICRHDHLFEIDAGSYRLFVNDNIAYQRDLAKIKRLMFD